MKNGGTNSTYNKMKDENSELKEEIAELKKMLSSATFPVDLEKQIELTGKMPQSVYDFFAGVSDDGDFKKGCKLVYDDLQESELKIGDGKGGIEYVITLPEVVIRYITIPLHKLEGTDLDDYKFACGLFLEEMKGYLDKEEKKEAESQ